MKTKRKNELKKPFTLQLTPRVSGLMDEYVEKSGAYSRSDFVEKAILKYVAFLDKDKKSEEDRMIAAVRKLENHMASVLFKVAGEQALLNQFLVEQIDGTITPDELRRLRNSAYDIVRRTAMKTGTVKTMMNNRKSPVNIRTKIPVKGRSRSLIDREITSYFKGTPDVMTVLEAAKAMRCSKNTVYTLIKEGRIQAVRVGRCFKVPKSALVDFMSCEKNYFIVSPDSRWTSVKNCGICVGDNKKVAAKTHRAN